MKRVTINPNYIPNFGEWFYRVNRQNYWMKHPKKVYQPRREDSLVNNPSLRGSVSCMIGRNTFSLTFNSDVATALDIGHKESLSYEIMGRQLIIRKME